MAHEKYKNIIFDLGAVIFQWTPEKFLDDAKLPSHYIEIFHSSLWLEHDGGKMTRENVIAHLPPQYDKELFRGFVSTLTKRMEPIPPMIQLFHELKAQGFKTFILSNMPLEMHQELDQMHDFFKYADGAVISGKVGQVKPNVDIYQTLLTKYHLDAHSSLFIDDKKENIQAAQALGIDGIICKDPKQVRRELISRGFHLAS